MVVTLSGCLEQAKEQTMAVELSAWLLRATSREFVLCQPDGSTTFETKNESNLNTSSSYWVGGHRYWVEAIAHRTVDNKLKDRYA